MFKSFIDKCVDEEASPVEIDEYIDKWHETVPQTQSLHDFLGMSWDEYSLWVADPDVLTYVVTARKENAPLGKVLRSHHYSLPNAGEGRSTVSEETLQWLIGKPEK